MRNLLTIHRRAAILPANKFLLLLRRPYIRSPPRPPPPPKPPSPPKKPQSFTFHDQTWEDPYSWMTSLGDKVAMRHMNIYMEQEEKYIDAVMSDTERFQSKLQSEMASRLAFELSSYPIRWGPWLYYRRVEEGKPFQVLCRRLASLNEEFISNKSPSAGFDFASGQKIEQKLLDYNEEADRFGGLAHEGLSEVSPDHRFIAYIMYEIDKGFNRLSVRNLNSGGALCDKPQVDRVTTLAWAKDGRHLLYVVTDPNKNRPCRIYCSTMGSSDEDVLVHEELDDYADLVIRNTKDFHFVTVNRLSPNSCKMYVINAADPLSGLSLVWECNKTRALSIMEHHMGFFYLFTNAAKAGQPVDSHYLLRSPAGASNTLRVWEDVFTNEPDSIIENVYFFNSHLVMSLKENGLYKLGSVPLPLPAEKGPFSLKGLDMNYLPLPKHVCHFSPGPNNDFYSQTVRFTISSPVMPDAVVDYDLSSGKWEIVQQQNVFRERAKILYGRSSLESIAQENPNVQNLWNDLLEFYACERHEVSSGDGARVPLTVVYCRKMKKEDHKPALIHGYGAYGQPLDKRWRTELKSLLDRGWTLAFADVRGGGGGGKTWHHDGRGSKKSNSVRDYISCAEYLVEKEIANENQLAGAGFGAGGLVVASAINCRPDLFRAVVLKFPFLDATNNLLYPIVSPAPVDYEEFGNPHKIDEFHAIRKYSPYDNIQKDVPYPAVLVSTSLQLNTRFGFWECAKWVARVRELTAYDPNRPVLLNMTMMPVAGDNRYLQCREAALESAFLIKIMRLP